jgi:hypothetical protein
MAILEHPDIPKSLFGIPGINLWNILMANVVISWLRFRKYEGLSWDMPSLLRRALIAYCIVMLVSFLRALTHCEKVVEGCAMGVICAYFINCFKWVLPMVILYDAIRTGKACRWALCAVIAFYFLISLQVMRHMPLENLRGGGSELRERSDKLLQRNVGYNRVNLSTMLAGASWAAFALASAFTDKRVKWALFGIGCINLLGQGLTGGKTGYGTWLVVGILLGLVRWRKLLVLMPVVCAVIIAVAPSIRDSLLQGFGHKSGAIVSEGNVDDITSGRTVIWPAVINKIYEAPAFGFGRDGYHASGVADYIAFQLEDPFPHPHNAYLEWMLDNGILGMLLIIPFYGFVVISSIKLFRSEDGLVSAAGGVALSLVCAQLVGSMGAQTFYPRESTVVMWAAIGIMARVFNEKVLAPSEAFSDSEHETTADVQDDIQGEPIAA